MRRPRSLRARLSLLVGVAVFASSTIVAGASVLLVARTAVDQVRADLRSMRDSVTAVVPTLGGPDAVCAQAVAGRTPPLFRDGLLVQLIRPDGSACTASGRSLIGPDIRMPPPVRGLFGAGLAQAESDTGRPLAVQRTPLAGGWRLDVASDIGGYESVLGRLRGLVFVLSLGAAVLAFLAGRAVARTGLRPVGRLAEAAEHIARTEDLTVRIPDPGGGRADEIGRLGAAFNEMTAALAASRERQARLVADAGHELRTPLTSLRTNVELLARSEAAGRPLPPEQRAALLADLTAQLAELGELATELTVLAGDEPARPRGDVRLDAVTSAAVERARRRAGGRRFDVELAAWVVPDADGTALERAVLNLLDNAVKFSPASSTVRVRLAGGVLTVDDAGPGVPPEYREAAFERFWRSDDARGLPGSGLGLAIVAAAAAGHGGSATLSASPLGGTRATLTLPGHSPDPRSWNPAGSWDS